MPRGLRIGVLAGGTDPYPLYTSFDRNDVPWHTASGGWGAQRTIAAPTPPTTSRSVTVNSVAEFNAEAKIPGTQITIGASFPAEADVTVGADDDSTSDIDVIVPAGRVLGLFEIGGWPRTSGICQRIRLRGAGRVGQIRIGEGGPLANYTDIIIDGTDGLTANGAGLGNSGGEANQGFRGNARRVACINLRVIAAGYAALAHFEDWFIGGCSFQGSAMPAATVGYDMGWGIRCSGGPVTIVDSDVRSGRDYHPLRPYTNNEDGEYLYVARTKIVNMHTGKGVWVWNKLETPVTDTTFAQAAYFDDCDIYGYAATSCGQGHEFDISWVTWSRLRNTRFHSGGAGNLANYTQSYLNDRRTAAISFQNGNTYLQGLGRVPLPADAHDVDDGNSFLTLTATPAWGGAGDPTTIPLPNGWTPTFGTATCPIYSG